MRRVLILVEGQTEETFARNILQPYLNTKELFCSPKIITTKRVKDGASFKGGITSYQKVKNDLKLLLKDSNAVCVTTMIDYYGFANKFSKNYLAQGKSCYEKVTSLEVLFKKDINDHRFIPYLQLHEFEAMLFVSPKEVAETLTETTKEKSVLAIANQFQSPEEINEDPNTHPSKCLTDIFSSYKKPLHGPLILQRIGLDAIRKKCKHFNDWLEQLEKYSE